MSYDYLKVINKLVEDTNLQKGDTFIDLGANLGQELEVVAPLGAIVHSFEPHPVLFEVVKEKYGQYPNVTLHNAAAWVYDGEVPLFFKNSKDQQNGGASLLAEKSNINKNLSETVPCVDIAKYIKDLNTPIKVLKIDVEGVEYVLLEKLLKEGVLDNVEFIYCEDHTRKCTSSEWSAKKVKVLSDLKEQGIALRGW